MHGTMNVNFLLFFLKVFEVSGNGATRAYSYTVPRVRLDEREEYEVLIT